MRRWLAAGGLALVALTAMPVGAAEPRGLSVRIDGDRFDIVGDGNTVVGLRRAPVPYDSLTELADALMQPRALPTAVRLQRAAPPQVIDYVFCVTDDGVLVVGQQVRTLDVTSGQYVLTAGDIKRAYPALEATSPWTWIVDIPLAREVALTLELKALTRAWPVRSVAVTPTVSR